LEVVLKYIIKMLAFAALFTSSLLVAAPEKGTDAFDQAAMEAIKLKVEARLSGFKVESIQPAPMADWFEIVAEGEIYYVSRSADHLFTGQLIAIKDKVVNLTEVSKAELDKQRSPMRAKILAAMKDSNLVTFPAKEEQHRIDVFVDADCGYCRKLHQHVDEMNNLGITVRYLGFPRAGLGTLSYKKLETAWCSTDKKSAFDTVMSGANLPEKVCENPIAAHYGLVPKFGIHGTPAIILSNGDLLPGYLTPPQLMTELTRRGL